MMITNINTKQIKEPAIHGESTVITTYWEFNVNGVPFVAKPHYWGLSVALTVSMQIDGETWHLSPDGPHRRKQDGSDGADYLPHTEETKYLAKLNYDTRNLAGILGGGIHSDPLSAEEPDRTPYHKGDDQTL